jgi:hypothetical protein
LIQRLDPAIAENYVAVKLKITLQWLKITRQWLKITWQWLRIPQQ